MKVRASTTAKNSLEIFQMNRRNFLVSTAALALQSGISHASSPLQSRPLVPEPNLMNLDKTKERTSVLLFFDDWPLDRRDHVERFVGCPEWHEEATFVDPHLNVTWGYPSVFRDSETGQWRCLYQGWDYQRKRLYPLVAESDDGVKWHVPNLARIPLPNRAHPNQVLPSAGFTEWSPCYYDERAEAAERLKGLVFFRHGNGMPKSHLWTSPDGLRWRCMDGIQWQRNTPDPVTCVFWNALRSSYVLTTRPSLNDRRIAVAETKDWRTFSDPELALEADALDTPLAELYGMPVFPYEDWFIGLLWVFHVSPEVKGGSPLKYFGGNINSQLSYSRNGLHFQRGLRQSFMGNASPGQLGAGCLQPCCLFLNEDTIRIYSCAARHEHGILRRGDGGLLLYTLRRDGFVYLAPNGGAGVIGTRPLLWGGGKLELNVMAPDGEVRAQVTDSSGTLLQGYSFAESIPFTGDNLRWEPRWGAGRSLNDLAERTLRVEVLLDNARLYSIRGTVQVLTAAEVTYFENKHAVTDSLGSRH